MAYAAVVSLKHHMEHLMDPTIAPYHINDAIATAKELLGITKAFDNKESNQRFDTGAIKALDDEIRRIAWKLEDVLESYALHHSLPPLGNNARHSRRTIEDKIIRFGGVIGLIRHDFNYMPRRPLDEEDEDEDGIPDFAGNKSTTVGLSEDQFKEINIKLLDAQRGLKVVSLVGMAGIGKTHFAKEIVQRPNIVKYFNCIVWVRVGQKGQAKNVLVDIIAQVEGKARNIYLNKNMYEIGMLLRKVFDGRELLIVLDDVWSEGVCHDIISRLEEAGATRVLLTTRLGHIIEDNKLRKKYQMRFLSSEESWSLLWRNVFVDESSYPPELEKVGRKIATSCEGLPLLILVVAHLLCGVERSVEYWEKVADKKTSAFDDAYDKIFNVLFSSYEYLPEELKTCFLYMGVFPQACEIPLSKLIHLWSVEVLLEPNLEKKFIESLEKLVSNSLLIICKQDNYYRKRMKSCKLHSAYWYVCVKEARNTKFLHVLSKLTDGAQEDIQGQRRLSVQNNILFGIKEVHDSMLEASTARSLLCTGKDQQYPVPICFNLMLLRVLDALSIRLYEFPDEVVKLLLLRYLALTYNGKLPSSISYLRHLQFLIVCRHHNIKVLSDSRSTCLPKEIWDMLELKHLEIRGYNISDPRYGAPPLPNLEKLYVNAQSCTEAVYAKLCNLKKLRISIELEPDATETSSCFEHIGLLGELESLKCVVVNPCLKSQGVPPPEDLSNLPKSLKKLSLSGLGYSWKYMTLIGSLPNLKVLKLRCSAFQGVKWSMEQYDFQFLEFLLLENLHLVEWYLDWALDGYLKHLQCLSIRHCFKLRRLPSIFLLQLNIKMAEVEIVDCSPSLVASAEHINLWYRRTCRRIVSSSSWSR